MSYAIVCMNAGNLMWLYDNDQCYMVPEGRLLFNDESSARTYLERYLDKIGITDVQRRAQYGVVPTEFNKVMPTIEERPQLPHPDRFEEHESWSASRVLEVFNNQAWATFFVPVSQLTGAEQMMSELVIDDQSDQIVGRKYHFAFEGTMDQAEIETFKRYFHDNGRWARAKVTLRGSGCARWFIVTLVTAQ